jgi:hypothetical protein
MTPACACFTMAGVMRRMYAGGQTGTRQQVLAWTALLAVTLLLAVLLQATVTKAMFRAAQAASAPLGPSPATAALADGDDVRARYIIGTPPETVAFYNSQRPDQ